jgi:hypothetical protein
MDTMKIRRVLALGEEAERLRPTTRSSSQPGSKRTFIQMTNASTKTVKMNWVDFEGREDINRIETIGPGSVFRHQTSTGHAFTGRDGDDQIFLLYIPLADTGDHCFTLTSIVPPTVTEEKPKVKLRSLWADLGIFVAVLAMLWYWKK